MKLSQIIKFSVVAAVLALLLAGCVSPPSPSPASSSSNSGVTSSPPIETTTGLETPQSPGGGSNVAISVAPLPTGKQANDGGCIHIAWLNGSIPHGDIVRVASVTVQSPFTFDQEATSHCQGGRSCVGYQFSAANDNNEAFCNVGLGYIGAAIDDDNGVQTDGTMELAGQLSCPGVDPAECRSDAAIMQHSGIGSIGFEVGVDLPGTPSSGPSSPENTPSSPTGTGSSSSPAPSSS